MHYALSVINHAVSGLHYDICYYADEYVIYMKMNSLFALSDLVRKAEVKKGRNHKAEKYCRTFKNKKQNFHTKFNRQYVSNG